MAFGCLFENEQIFLRESRGGDDGAVLTPWVDDDAIRPPDAMLELLETGKRQHGFGDLLE